MGGQCFVDEKLGRRKLDFIKDKSGLHILIGGKEVFAFSLHDHDHNKGFSLAYERLWPDGTMCFHGRDPNANFPQVERSCLRHILDDCLLEIYFKGKILLKFSRWAHPRERTWKIYRIQEGKDMTAPIA